MKTLKELGYIDGTYMSIGTNQRELGDQPKEKEGNCYYPVLHVEEDGTSYYTFIKINEQVRDDTVKAIMNITGLDKNQASRVASVYFRRVDYGTYRELYEAIEKETKEVTEDRRIVDIVDESLKRAKHALSYGGDCRGITITMSDKDLREFFRNSIVVTNPRVSDYICVEEKYPFFMDKVNAMVEKNKPYGALPDSIEENTRYIIKNTSKGNVLTKKR